MARNISFHGPTNYANQQLSLAIRIIAVGSADMCQRLVNAYYKVHPLTTLHFQEHLREDFAWVISHLTKYDPEINFEGKVQKRFHRKNAPNGMPFNRSKTR